MIITTLEFAVGLVIACVSLADVLMTILVPGATKGRLRLTRRMPRAASYVWRYMLRLAGQDSGRRLSNVFAPTLFFLAFLFASSEESVGDVRLR
jgi:hypothetical protein